MRRLLENMAFNALARAVTYRERGFRRTMRIAALLYRSHRANAGNDSKTAERLYWAAMEESATTGRNNPADG